MADRKRPPSCSTGHAQALASLLLCALLPLLGCGRKADPVAPGQRRPAAVSQLQIAGPGGQLTLSWQAPTRDLGGRPLAPPAAYQIWRAAWPPEQQECTTCPETTTLAARIDAEQHRAAGRPDRLWVDREAVPGWRYQYRVAAVPARGPAGPPSAPVTITWLELPLPSFVLEARDRGAQARFADPQWPPPGIPSAFRIYDNSGRLLAEQAHPATQVSVVGLENHTPYPLEGRLLAHTAEGWPVESRGLQQTVVPLDRVPPLPPETLVSFSRIDAVQLDWVLPRGEAYAQILILRSPSGAAPQELAQLPGNAVTYTDRGVVAGQAYQYSLIGVDADGNRSLQTRPVAGRALDSEDDR